ncbi:uncharacterized protein LOC114005330 [Tupaia chinensis]|uniref:uncharacterized protein LOC114005330 n=1 Tax=Tupaia chinensis TaxID=246437 RepID=UPI000FFBF463|nr:uncharacterized protein LOC114005330 [Tupaia chinensis]
MALAQQAGTRGAAGRDGLSGDPWAAVRAGELPIPGHGVKGCVGAEGDGPVQGSIRFEQDSGFMLGWREQTALLVQRHALICSKAAGAAGGPGQVTQSVFGRCREVGWSPAPAPPGLWRRAGAEACTPPEGSARPVSAQPTALRGSAGAERRLRSCSRQRCDSEDSPHCGHMLPEQLTAGPCSRDTCDCIRAHSDNLGRPPHRKITDLMGALAPSASPATLTTQWVATQDSDRPQPRPGGWTKERGGPAGPHARTPVHLSSPPPPSPLRSSAAGLSPTLQRGVPGVARPAQWRRPLQPRLDAALLGHVASAVPAGTSALALAPSPTVPTPAPPPTALPPPSPSPSPWPSSFPLVLACHSPLCCRPRSPAPRPASCVCPPCPGSARGLRWVLAFPPGGGWAVTARLHFCSHQTTQRPQAHWCPQPACPEGMCTCQKVRGGESVLWAQGTPHPSHLSTRSGLVHTRAGVSCLLLAPPAATGPPCDARSGMPAQFCPLPVTVRGLRLRHVSGAHSCDFVHGAECPDVRPCST